MKKLLCVVAALLSTASFAKIPDVVIDGTVTSKITLHIPDRDNKTGQTRFTDQEQEVTLLHVSLSPKAKMYLANAAVNHFNHPYKSEYADQKQLGMGILPPLNQGAHGSCVTFALTAALDATYDVGDYISQLCNLELGTYLEQQDHWHPSGWNGSFSDIVFGQIRKYGVITMFSQFTHGCGGLYKYPMWTDTNATMSVDEFKSRSIDTFSNVKTNDVLTLDDAFDSDLNRDTTLDKLKQAIRAGHRVVIATMSAKMYGKHGMFYNDSWILSPEVLQDLHEGRITSAHEIIITGYDDQAVITGPSGSKHQGVFTIRNSWGIYNGNFGDNYMSYDYFKTFVFEAVEVSK